MSQEFQLQLIRKSLEELGHGPVADLLAKRIDAQRLPSAPRSLVAAVLEQVSAGEYPAALSLLQDDDFHFAQGNGSVQLLSAGQRALAAYLVTRASFLEKIVETGLAGATPADCEAAVRFLQNELALAYAAIDFADPLVADTALVLNGLLLREHESSTLMPLALHPPNALTVESAVFTSAVLLSLHGRSAPSARDARSYLQRLRTSLNALLRSTLTPATSLDRDWYYTDIPDNCLADLIRSASLHNLLHSLYYLPPRTEPATEDAALMSLSAAPARKDDLPIHLLHTLAHHTDEVWFTRFSPTGRYLATGSLDGTCIIYDVTDNFKVLAELDASAEDEEAVFVLSTHKPALDKKKGIIYFCWEPHERYIVTCCLDTVIRVWHVENITLAKRITRLMDDVKPATLVSCFTLGERMRTWPCEFLQFEKSATPHFIVGSPDKVLKVFTVDGTDVLDFYSDADEWLKILDENSPNVYSEIPTSFTAQAAASIAAAQQEAAGELSGNVNGSGNSASQFNRINDFAITPNGKVLITANNDKQVFFYKIPNLFDPAATTSRIALLSLNGRLTSCTISANGKYMLLSIAPEELQVWDISPLENFEKPFLKQKFLGQSQAIYMVRSCFGYLNINDNEEELVLSGSDDGYIYIWNLETGRLITRVRGHHGLCNSVDWNRLYKPPKHGKDYGLYWSSVGDDKLVKIWGPRP